MIITKNQAQFVEWLSAEEMHKTSQNWLSELQFIKDEHFFFEDLIKSYTLQLIDSKSFSDNKEIIDALNRSQRRTNLLIESIKIHENELKVMVDNIDQPQKEGAYKKKHRELIIIVSKFLKNYNLLKTQLFGIVKTILKTGKQLSLLDNKQLLKVTTL